MRAVSGPLSAFGRARNLDFVAPAVLGASLCLVILSGCARSGFRPGSTDGGSVFREACFTCHGGSGGAKPMPGRNLAPEQVEKALRSGARGMPAFPNIRGEARENLVRYVVAASR